MSSLEQAWEEGFDFARAGSYYEGCNPYTVVKPVPKTFEERIAFEQAWDAKVEASKKSAQNFAPNEKSE